MEGGGSKPRPTEVGWAHPGGRGHWRWPMAQEGVVVMGVGGSRDLDPTDLGARVLLLYWYCTERVQHIVPPHPPPTACTPPTCLRPACGGTPADA